MDIDPLNITDDNVNFEGEAPRMYATLRGVKEPMWELTREMPWHRMAAYAFALGASARDVARKLEKSEPAVQNLLRQKWFQKMVTEFMAESGARDIIDMFRAEQFNSLCTLVEMRDDTEIPAACRITCARDILDRALGKPVQRVETTDLAQSDNPVAEVEKLEREVNRLKEYQQP